MKKAVRRVLFYIFFGAFCILAPLIVLYTAGYRFSIKSGLDIDLDVGSLSITSIPRRANLVIDGIPSRHRTPHVFQELTPGKHNVQITRTGFFPWEGSISIIPGLTTYIQHAVLFKQSNWTSVVRDLSTESIVAIYDETIAYTRTSTDKSEDALYILKRGSENPHYVTKFTNKKPSQISWSHDGNYMLVTFPDFFEIYTANGKYLSWPTSITENIAVQDVRWDTNQNDILYITMNQNDEEQHLAVNIRKEDIIEQYPQRILGVVEDTTFYIKSLFASDILVGKRGNQEAELAILPRSDYTLLDIHPPYLVLQDGQGDLYFIHPAYQSVITTQAKQSHIDWNKNSDMLTYTNGGEINILTLSQQQRDLIWRSSEHVVNVLWHPTGQRIIFATETSVEAIDAYQYALVRNHVTLGDLERIEQIWLSENGDVLYVLGIQNTTRNLFSLRLK